MADEYRVQIGTDADVSGAKEAEKALEQLGGKAKEAAAAVSDVGEQSEASSKSGKALNDSLQNTGDSAEGTRKILGGLGMLLSGNVLQGTKELTEGFRFLNQAMLANPAGRLVAVLSLLAGAWGVVSRAMQSTAKEAETVEGTLDKTSQAAERLAGQLSDYEKLAAAMKELADQTERLRKVQDELTDADLAVALAGTDLAVAKGQMSEDEARAKRGGLRQGAAREKSAEAIRLGEAGNATGAQRAQELLEREAAAKAAAERMRGQFARDVQGGLAVGAPLDMERPGENDFAAERAEAAARLERAQAAVGMAQGEPGSRGAAEAAAQVEAAKAQVEWIDKIAESRKRLEELDKAAAEASETRAKGMADISKAAEERTMRVELERRKAAAGEMGGEAEQLNLQNDQERRRKEFEEKEAERLAKLNEDLQKPGNARRAEDAKRERERADLEGEAGEMSRDISQGAGKLKGPSPEATARLQQAASALADGASAEEMARLNSVLEQLATGLEKRGKETDQVRELQGKITRLEGVVDRLNRQQGR